MNSTVQHTADPTRVRSAASIRERLRLTRHERLAIVFVLPLMLLLVVFLIVPMVSGFARAFQNWAIGGLKETEWIGFGNYVRMVQEWRFWNSIRVTLTYAAGLLVIPYCVALPLALFMNMKIPGRAVFRTLFFLPAVTPISAAGLVFVYLFSTDFGIVNSALMSMGFIQEPIGWLGHDVTAVATTMALVIWTQVGFNAVTLLTGLQVITKEITEAATIDGAHGWSMFRFITLPMLKPTSVVVVASNLIGAFKMFGPIYVTTLGGPAKATEVLGLYIYENGFHYWQLGYATAVATVVLALCLVVNYIMARVGRVDWQ
jgi:multiple sugar transport system permease protein